MFRVSLGISQPWDMVQLHPELKPMWCAITEHYKHIGLSHSENIMWDIDLKQLGQHIGFIPSVFFFGPNEFRYWGDNEWLDTVEYINSKNRFMDLADELGVPIPATLRYDNVTKITADTIRFMNYPCYLKAAVSVSGVGIYRCSNEVELRDAIKKFDETTPVQIQEEVETDTFLNLQYEVVGDELHRLTASEQILEGFTHQGNRVPASHEPWEAVEPMAIWLKERGIKGIFAFDVAVVQTRHGLRFLSIECNPRYNGASYPTIIANKLGVTEWCAQSLSTQHRNLNDIDLSGIEYNPSTGKGVVIVNWGTILAGKLVFLIAGNIEEQQRYLARLKPKL